jgi:hypothetical protein
MLVKIINANEKQMDIFINAARDEGWNPGFHDAKSFYACDNSGFWLGFSEKEKIVSMLSFVNYQNSDFSFVGFYIVKPEYRNQNNGYALWQNVFSRYPGRNVALDGVPAQVENYKRSGFIFANTNCRYCGRNFRQPAQTDCLISATDMPFADICAYDRLHFPAARQAFLRSWLDNAVRALVFSEHGKIKGLGVIRKCFDGYKIGPLFCDNYQIAYKIFNGLISNIRDENIFLDIMETNEDAKRLVLGLGMKPVFTTARMYTKKSPDIRWNNVFGLTTFELG